MERSLLQFTIQLDRRKMKYFILLMLFFVSNPTLAHNNNVFHFHETGTSFFYITAGIIFATFIFIFVKEARSS